VSQGTLLLDEHDLRELLTPTDANRVTEQSLAALGRGRALAPPKLALDLGAGVDWPAHGGVAIAMPAYVGDEVEALGKKWVASYAANPSLGMPTVHGLIVLSDPGTGRPLAVLAGNYLTALRTGATSAVGAKHLIGSARRLGLVGAGEQAREQVRCLAAAFDLERIQVAARRPESAARFCDELSRVLGRPVLAAPDATSAVDGCDLVVVATSATTPALDAGGLAACRLVITLGGGEELADDVVDWAERIVVDQRASAHHRGALAPKLRRGVLAEERLQAELPEVVAGLRPELTNGAGAALLLHLGIGAADVALAQLAVERARVSGRGREFDFGF
jgi:alanine dehydrogenase